MRKCKPREALYNGPEGLAKEGVEPETQNLIPWGRKIPSFAVKGQHPQLIHPSWWSILTINTQFLNNGKENQCLSVLSVHGQHEMWFSSMAILTRRQWSRRGSGITLVDKIPVSHFRWSQAWFWLIHSCVLFWAVSPQQKFMHAEASPKRKATWLPSTLLRHRGLFLTYLGLFSCLLLVLSRFGSVNRTMFTVGHSPHCQSPTTSQ